MTLDLGIRNAAATERTDGNGVAISVLDRMLSSYSRGGEHVNPQPFLTSARRPSWRLTKPDIAPPATPRDPSPPAPPQPVILLRTLPASRSRCARGASRCAAPG